MPDMVTATKFAPIDVQIIATRMLQGDLGKFSRLVAHLAATTTAANAAFAAHSQSFKTR